MFAAILCDRRPLIGIGRSKTGYSMKISYYLNSKLSRSLAAVCLLAVSLSACQKVSVPRVSSTVGNVNEVSSDFVAHYLDTDAKSYASSQSILKQVASPGCVQSMLKGGVLAKNPKELKAKTAQLAKKRYADVVDVQKVEPGDVTANGLIPVVVRGELLKSVGKPTPFAYKLLLGVRKDNGKLAVVTITKL